MRGREAEARELLRRRSCTAWSRSGRPAVKIRAEYKDTLYSRKSDELLNIKMTNMYKDSLCVDEVGRRGRDQSGNIGSIKKIIHGDLREINTK